MPGAERRRTTPEANEHAAPPTTASEYTLSETRKAAIWAELARITPALKEAQAKVLSWLTSEALSAGHLSIRASCRDVAAGSGVAKSSAITATRDLVTLRLIAKCQGTATRAAAYLLRFAETLPMRKREGGPVAGPPVDFFPPFQPDQGGPVAGPPPFAESQQNELFPHSAPGVLSIDQSSTSLSDVEKASFNRSSDFFHNEQNSATCRGLMLGFVKHRLRWVNPHPPDQKIVSMMLCVCEWEALEKWLTSMITGQHNEPPRDLANPYAWLLKVAVNKIHGIAPGEQKPTLELLRGGKQLYTRWHSEGLK